MQLFGHTTAWARCVAVATALCALAALAACNDGTSSGGGNNNRSAIVAGNSIDATISGLNSTGLVLKVVIGNTPEQSEGIRLASEGTRLLTLHCMQCDYSGWPVMATVSVPTASTSEQLAASVAPGMIYAVTIQQQPIGETCNVENGTGMIQTAGVSDVVVSCTDQSYTVGGSITGLTASGLVLLDNGGDALTVDANATEFTMKTPIAYGSNYAVAVQTAPAGLVCSVSNGTGTMAATDITSVTVGCVPNFTLLYSFAGGSSDGSQPYHSLIQASDGTFYGTTQNGGASNQGTIFEITPSGVETVLYSFAEGAAPYAAIIQGSDGNFYGTTAQGGTKNIGMVFEITPSGNESVLYSFLGGTGDGNGPYTGVIQGSDGNFYGTTYFGGTANVGTIFRVAPNGAEAVLHSFAKSTTDGYHPFAGLFQASDGNFYGTTYYGGTSSAGTVFKITPSGTETVLYSFTGGSSDGANPYGGVIQGTDGNFYGTTYNGGSHGFGTVFKITPSGTETVLYSFAGGASDGASPEAGLTLGRDGNLYGATYVGGTNNLGTVFEITPSGVETVLHSFTGGSSDGAGDWANLVQGTDGNLYGSSFAGGANGDGTFFTVALQ